MAVSSLYGRQLIIIQEITKPTSKCSRVPFSQCYKGANDFVCRLHYKVLVTYNVSNGGVRTSLDESVLVKEPPAIYQPTQTASRYYIAVNLVDDHGYVGPLSEVLHLESMEICKSTVSYLKCTLIRLLYSVQQAKSPCY